MSKGASLAPQEIRIDFAVLPETKSQGLFHQIQKEVTFCGLGKTWKKEEELKQLKSELSALDRKIQLELAPKQGVYRVSDVKRNIQG